MLSSIIDAIHSNKEWLFSGAGIVFLTIFCRLLRPLIYKGNTKETDQNAHQINANPVPNVSKITAQEIVESINSAPPFQKDQIAKQYNGITVKWIGYLKEASKDPRDKSSVRVNLNVNREAIVGTSIWFTEKVSKFPEIRTLKRGSEIHVVGKILSASGQGLCVDVKPIAIEVLDGYA